MLTERYDSLIKLCLLLRILIHHSFNLYGECKGRFGFFSSIPPTRVVVDGVETSVQYDNMTMIACFNLEAPKKLPVIERLEAVGAFTFSFGDEQRKIDIIWHST